MTRDSALTALAANLRLLRGAAEEHVPNDREFVQVFWARDLKAAPQAISSPDEYDGGPDLGINCAKDGTSARARKSLVTAWCNAIPSFTSLRAVRFQFCVPQELFDATCRLSGLERLYASWHRIARLDAIAGLTSLKRLHIAGTKPLTGIEPLSALTTLTHLHIDSVRITSLEPLSTLSNLTELGFTGTEFAGHVVDSFSPLSSLVKLEKLYLGALRTSDMSLEPLGSLKALRLLRIGNFFSVEEFGRLSARIPQTLCNWLHPFERFHESAFPCKRCNQNWKVMPAGKERRMLCPTCDAEALARHVLAFEAARNEVLNLSECGGGLGS